MSSKQSNGSSVEHAVVAAMAGDDTNHRRGNDSSSNKAVQDDDSAALPDLNDVYLTVPNLSLEPMTAASLVVRVQDTMTAVMTRYLPCACFFIGSQCHLDSGLQHQQSTNNALTASQFFETFVAPLPGAFKDKNLLCMPKNALDGAFQGLEQLVSHAKLFCSQGIVQVVQDFTGGLQEGQPYGLRKWFTDHSHVLSLCTNLECSLQACVKLDASLDTTRNIAQLIRPMAQRALDHLLEGFPMYYRKHVPIFHRLESDLRNMSTFNPNDNDDDVQVVGESKPAASNNNQEEDSNDAGAHEVICIDDDSDSEDDDDDDDCDKESDKTSSAASMSGSGLYKAAVQPKSSRQRRWDAVNRSLRRRWCLLLDHNHDHHNAIPTVPPIATTTTGAAKDSNHSIATSLNENEENQPQQESATASSSETGFYKTVIQSKTGAPVTVKRSLRLR